MVFHTVYSASYTSSSVFSKRAHSALETFGISAIGLHTRFNPKATSILPNVAADHKALNAYWACLCIVAGELGTFY